jgi:hypothetical protein
MSDVSDMSDGLRGRNGRRSNQNRSGNDRADLTSHLKLHFHFQNYRPFERPDRADALPSAHQ